MHRTRPWRSRAYAYAVSWCVESAAIRCEWHEDPEVLMYRMVDLMMSGSVIHEIDEGPGSWDPGT